MVPQFSSSLSERSKGSAEWSTAPLFKFVVFIHCMPVSMEPGDNNSLFAFQLMYFLRTNLQPALA